MLIFDDFIVRALAAGICLALVASALGCFVVWRRMAYFGDSLAHSSLLGVALGLTINISTNIGIIISCSLFAVLLLWLQKKRVLATDTLLGIMAHSALAIGMVAISLLEERVSLHAYLFGDILTVTTTEIYWIYAGGLFALLLLKLNWSSLVLMTIQEDLATAEGVRTFWMHLLLMLLMTIVVSVSIRIVGILLITSMLIIPAASARQISRSPESMALCAILLGITAVVSGILASMWLDTPSGPTIVSALAVLFLVVSVLVGLWRYCRRGRLTH